MGGIKRSSKFFKDDNGGEREEELTQPKVEEGLFIVFFKIWPLPLATSAFFLDKPG